MENRIRRGQYRRNRRENRERKWNRDRSHSSENSKAKIRHPPHLRGKAIGMFYARRAREKRQTKKSCTVGRVVLSETRQNSIESSLNDMDITNQLFTTDNGSYDHVKDSQFKRDFLQTIRGSIEDNLKEPPQMLQDTALDEKLYDELQKKVSSNKNYQEMLEVRKKLPSFKMKDEIISMIRENNVVVVSGETGCGKTTQVSQFILDDYIMRKEGSMCYVVCSQPRRISAVSIAERVAEERAERLGKSVGYHIRLERQTPRNRGAICYCTTGVILKWMETDPCLSNVSHLILDEIHERDVMSDFIIAVMKKVIAKRHDLKLILMSATLNAEKFSKYYNDCPHINIPGFTFPVEEYYLEDVLQRTGFVYHKDRNWKSARRWNAKKKLTEKDQEWKDFVEPYIRTIEHKQLYSRHVCEQLRNPMCEEVNLDLIFALLVNICNTEKDSGAILVFVTGIAEISSLIKLLENSEQFPKERYIIIALHSQLPTVDQRRIFNKPPKGVRKIIISTNIAETSITIDDVTVVIDCGKIKMSNYNVQTNTQTLLPEWVSLANANQRKGRAGRTQPGKCFHLFTKIRRITLEEYQLPEVLRKRLEDTILTIKVLKLGKIAPFLESLMDSPDPKAVEASIKLLMRLNALDKEETLTPLGYHLARLPMAPQMGKMILMGAIFGCLDPILSIAATLDFKDAFLIPLGKEKENDLKKLELSNGWRNDHMVFIEAMKRFETSSNRRRYCHEFFLSWNTMTLLQSMKKQFMEYLHEMNFVPSVDPKCKECNINSENKSLVQAIICSGLYPNVAILRRKNRHCYSMKTMEDYTSVKFHPKSLLAKGEEMGTNIVIYSLKLKSSCTFLHDASIVNPLSLLFFGDTFVQSEENEECTMGVGDNVNFKTNPRTAAIVKELRERLNWFLEYKVAHPGPVNWDSKVGEAKLLGAIIQLITSEDKGELSDSEDDCLFVDEVVELGNAETVNSVKQECSTSFECKKEAESDVDIPSLSDFDSYSLVSSEDECNILEFEK